MKICIVSLNIVRFYDGDADRIFGGAEVQADFVAHALKAAGHEVVLVVSDLAADRTLPHPAENAFNSEAGVPGIRFFHPRWTGINSALQRADADVYYQRNAGMITGLTASFCKRHGRTFVYGAGSDVDFHPQTVSIKNARDRMIFFQGLKSCHGVVVQNLGQQRAATGVIKQPVRVIPNGIAGTDGGIDSAKRGVVWVGSMRALKRPDLALDIARALPECNFTIIGGRMTGEDTLNDEIVSAATSLPNVRMTGRLPHADVDKIIRDSQLLINTSDVEGFPNAYLEAWAAGVPVITRNDIDGIIGQSRAGMVCETTSEMTSAIRDILAAPEQLAKMNNHAIELVQTRFSPHVLGNAYSEFFHELRGETP